MNICRSVLLIALTLAPAGTVFAADQNTQALYQSKCQGCHGADGAGSGIGKKLGARGYQDPNVVKMSESDLARITETGKNKMPAYKGKLTDAQIKDLAKYIKELSRSKLR